MARIRPSKPAAVVGAIAGVAIVIFGVVQIGFDTPFVWLWAAIGIAIVAFNLWAAFAKRGATQVVETDDRSRG
ncbi:hypothetical protein [Pseudonocardia nigra]|uniref:hypothetical protein n=1 Tax=Pseudonocardia nigra TaxID=1921578 RepID=UPI001C5CF117|nr:hypothetical protein [Pseudonocardia nigra]